MAHYKSDIVDVNLETGVIHRSFLMHSIGYKDDDADRFGIRAFRNGQPESLSGASCQAIFMAPDGTNIALTSYGTIAGNEAYVTLPPACYDVEGQFTLAIKIVGGGVTSTVRIIDGVVSRTGATGTVSPTSAVPTYQEIIAQFDEMVEATAAANTAIEDMEAITKLYLVEPTTTFTPNVTRGKYRNFTTNAFVTDSSTAYSESFAKLDRSAVTFTNTAYKFSVMTYSSTEMGVANLIEGFGWLDAGDIVVLPSNTAAFIFQWKKIDGTTIGSDEESTLQAGIKIYTTTDKTLTLQNKAADAKKTGDLLSAITTTAEVDKTTGTTINYFIGYSQGQILSSSRTVRTIYFPCVANAVYKLDHAAAMQFVVGCYTSTPQYHDYATKWYNGRNETTTIFQTDATARYLAVYYYSSANTGVTEQEAYDALHISTVGIDYIVSELNKIIDGGNNYSLYNGCFVANDTIKEMTTFDSVIELYDELVSEYPDFVTKNTLTSGSFTNYEYVFTLGDYNGGNGRRDANPAITKPTVLMISGIHGYERSAVMSLYTMMAAMCQNDCNLNNLIEFATFRVIPVGCPYSFTNETRVNANGVNINRNFATSSWELIGEPGDADYSGAEPGDQDETKVIQNWILAHNDAVIYFDYHNSSFVSEVVQMSGGQEGEPLNFKKKWLMGINKVIPHWRKDRNMDSSANYYCYTGGLGSNYQSSRGFATEMGQIALAYSHETSWNVNGSGKHSKYTIGVGAEAMANGLLGVRDFLDLTHVGQSE